MYFQGNKVSSILLTTVKARCFHKSALAAAAAKVAMSKYDPNILPYDKLANTLDIVKKRLGRPLTLSEKVLYSHIDQPDTQVRQILNSVQEVIIKVNADKFV